MSDAEKSKKQLIHELQNLREQLLLRQPDNQTEARGVGASGDFEDLFNSLRTPASILDVNLKYQRINQAYEQYTGIPKAAILGATPAAVVGETRFLNKIKPHLDLCLSGQRVEFEDWFDFQGVGRRYMHVIYTPRTDPTGAITGILHISSDFTGRYDKDALSSAILHATASSFWLADKQGRILSVNKAAAAMLGYSTEELTSMTIFNIDASGSQRIEQRIKQVIVQGQAAFETLHRRKNGTLIQVEVVASFHDLTGGRFVVFIRDLTAEKEAEQKLLASKSRIQRKLNPSFASDGDFSGLELDDLIDTTMLQSLSDAFHQLTGMVFALLDTEGKVFVAAGWQDICAKFHRKNSETNKRCLKSDTILTRGLRCGEFKQYRCENHLWDMATPLVVGGRHVGNIFTGQFILKDEEPDREVFLRQARQFGFDEQTYMEALDKVPRLDKKQVDTVMHFYSQLADMLATTSYSNLNLAWTVAEKDALNARLLESEAKYRTYVDSSPVAIFVVSKQGLFTDANPAACSMLGYARDELLEMDISQLAFSETGSDPLSGFRALQSEGVFNGEICLRRKDDSSLYALLNAVKIGPDNALAFCQDITARRQAEAALLQAKAEAEASNRAKSSFLANMSHEIRTPLNGVLGMLQLLHTTPLDAEQREYSHNAIKSSQRLTRLLSDILDLSRIEADKLPLETIEFDIQEQKQAVLDTFIPLVREKKIDIIFHIDDRLPPTLVGNETRLRQILFNLVGNAIKFTEKGGVEVNIHALDKPWLSSPRLLLEVKDTGIGIPDERTNDIFEPFTQIEGDYRRHFQGAGLGLPIVKKLVQLMGGSIAVNETEGGGSTIYVSLPFSFPHSSMCIEIENTPNVLPVAGDMPTILIADDDKLSLLTARKMLERMGSAIITAKNGHEVLHALSKHKVDLVLMDIQMPVLDGVETTRRIRASKEPYAAIPIIAMTAYAMKGDKHLFLNAGMNGHLAKPVEMAHLQDAINNAMRDKKTRSGDFYSFS